MATFDAAIDRAVAIELRAKTVKLYFDTLSIWQAVSGWTLNALDPALPAPYDVKIQLDAYQSLTLERLRLSDWVADLQKAQFGDTLTYPTPPVIGEGFIGFEIVSFDEIYF